MAHATGKSSSEEAGLIKRVKKICASLPDVGNEKDGFGHTSFKVRKKTFVMIGVALDHGGPHRARSAGQAWAYIRAPYIGQHGWDTVWRDDPIDWNEVSELIVDAYRMSAPKRLLQQLGD